MTGIYRKAAIVALGAVMIISTSGCFIETAQARKTGTSEKYKLDKKKFASDSDEIVFDEDNEDLGRELKVKKVKTSKKENRDNRSAVVGSSDDSIDQEKEYEEKKPVKYGKKNKFKEEEKSDESEEIDDSPYQKEKFFQTGMASWYGREFHGKTTASGEKFNMNDLTAAHKTLPFGTVVEVKNLDNGKAVKVKINDRGPYKGDRIIDLSYDAAKEIGMVSKGEVPVGINVVGKTAVKKSKIKSKIKPKDVEPVSEEQETDIDDQKISKNDNEKISKSDDDKISRKKESLSIQAGAFYSKKNAEKQTGRLEELLTGADVQVVHEGDLYRVVIQGISSKKEAEKFRKILSKEKISTYLIKE
jgi:rare lipoprotein A